MDGSVVRVEIQEHGNVQIEFSDVSTGSQQIMTIVTGILTFPPNSVILIEEPEQNLHAKAQRSLLRLMKTQVTSSQQQFFLTTHSTIFSQVNDKVHTYLIGKHNGSSTIHKLEEPSELKSIKDSLGHQNADMFNYNAVIIVEGYTEESTLPKLAENLGIDLVECGIKIINLRGSGKTKNMRELVNYLKDGDTEMFLILDNHSNSLNQLNELINQRVINAENVLWVSKGFEDIFTDDLLANALVKVADHEGFKVSIPAERVKQYRSNEKPIFKSLEQLYFEITKSQNGLSKLLFADKLLDEITLQKIRIESTDLGKF